MIKELTSLRGIFILFLFLYHAWNNFPGDGTMPVVFFFVLGGFGMTLGYYEKVVSDNFDYKKYIIKRAVKFYPLHWICLLATVPFVLFHFSWVQIPCFIVNAALLQTWVPLEKVYFSYNAVSWYLADTLFFSAVFPFLFKGLFRLRKNSLVITLIIISFLYFFLVSFLPFDLWHAILYINPLVRLTDFLFGIGLALFYILIRSNNQLLEYINKYSRLFEFIDLVLVVFILVENCYLCESLIRFVAPIYWPLTAIIIVLSALLGSVNQRKGILRSKMLVNMGRLSFSVFLVHQLLIRYVRNIFDFFSSQNNFIYVSVCFVLTIILSFLIDKFVLHQITQWLTKKIQLSMTAHS